jgi:hypothetical protein
VEPSPASAGLFFASVDNSVDCLHLCYNGAMKIITAGHTYELASYKQGGNAQMLHFVHKQPQPDSTALMEVADGTTTEEVIAVLIARIEHLNGILPSRHNTTANINLRRALKALQNRTASRIKRRVEGTNLK